ncbi:MAG TPA: hypothetical protein DEF30_04225 [Proteiniclasticum sp.]|uniref:DUF6731 family protein n=1 Tax=Proteiniclasticum sp. TaxID=2053595 RepID=UPI000E80A68A|nr:DUF6731 family protein [Proteiniclasticum sp.]HBW13019.1 hypothetical protein [Proteiniclasticum sp.]
MSYIKNIKFNYFQVLNNYTNGEGNPTAFSMTDWADTIDKKTLLKKHIELSKCLAKIEYISHFEISDIWKVRLHRLAEYNIPQTSKNGEDAEDVELQEDEYLGYDCNLIYDETNGIAMIQRSKYSLSIERIEELLNKTSFLKDRFITIKPIMNSNNINKLIQNGKKIEISFANITNAIPETKSPLASIINSFFKLKGVAGNVTIGVGRGKDVQVVKENNKEKIIKTERFLGKKETIQLIDDIRSNPDIVTRGIVTLRDEEDTNVEVVDLFDDVFIDIIQFQLEQRKTLGIEYVMNEMIQTYEEKKGKILISLKSDK